MEQEPPDPLPPLSFIVKTEPEWLAGGSSEPGDINGGENYNVDIKEEPQEESTRLTVTNTFPSLIPSNPLHPLDSSKDQESAKQWFSRSSMDHREGKLFEIDGESDDAEIKLLLAEFEEQEDPNKKKKMNKCPACDFETPVRRALVRHKIAAHGEQKYACPHCDFRTGYLTDLARHEKKSHASHKYYCSKCKFSTSVLGAITKHEIVHSNDYLYCNECSFKTKYERSLKQHKLKHIVGCTHKAFSCRFCRRK